MSCTGSEWTIRPATNSDREQVVQLIFSVLDECGLPVDPDGADSELKDLEQTYQEQGGFFAVVQDAQGRLVGTVAVAPFADDICELRKMYLLPEAPGKGLGRRLLNRAVEWATEKGYREVRLETASVLVEVIALYTRFGFRELPIACHSGRCDRLYGFALSPPQRLEKQTT